MAQLARRARSILVVVLCASLTVAVLASPAPAADDNDASGAWQRPVEGRVVEPFRAPGSAYGAGHRGADLAAAPGTPVRAANDGVVSFAGNVAGTLHVVIAHDGNLRTSYSFLASVAVHTGESVARGAIVGTTGGTGEAHDGTALHFGLRVGDRYVDPMQLFRPVDLTKLVHLVPSDDPDEHPWTPGAESTELRTSLRLPLPAGALASLAAVDDGGGCGDDVPLVGGIISDACAVADWIGDRANEALDAGLRYLQAVTGISDEFVRRLRGPLRATADLLRQLPDALARSLARTPPGQFVLDVVEMGRRFVDTVTADCDDSAPAADGTGGSGHRVMVVAGIDSSGGAWDSPTVGIDVKALGYYRNEGEIRYFSYTADGGAYTKADTLGDLDLAAQHLLAQLRAMQREQPGREVDLVGHSQGGVVIDIFLSKYYDPADPSLPPLGNVITLSSPHEGAPLSTAAGQARSKTSGRIILDDLVGDGFGLVPPAGSKAVGQLTEGSPTIKSLFPHGLPEHVNYTTIGADTDYVVPATNISVPGATETVIAGGDLDLLNEHSAIVSDSDALRAVRSALEGRAPPCVSIGKAIRGAVVPVIISRFEHSVGDVAKQKLP
jgi:hypothetical protein